MTFAEIFDTPPIRTGSAPNWIATPTALPIRLAGKQIARPTLRLVRDDRHFLERPVSDWRSATAERADIEGADGMALLSAPDDPSLSGIRFADGKLVYVAKRYPRHVLDLSVDPEALLADWSAKSRSTLKRKIKRVEKASGGALDILSVRTGEEMAAFLAEARPLSEKTYQHRLLDAGLPLDDGFSERMIRTAEADAVRAWLMRIDGDAVAYLLCPAQGDVLLYEFVGYDPDFTRLSVGMVLQWTALQELMREGKFRYFDFTPGDGQHKAQFASERYDCADVYVLRPSFRTVFTTLAHCCAVTLDNAASAAAERLGVKQRLKRLVRGQR